MLTPEQSLTLHRQVQLWLHRLLLAFKRSHACTTRAQKCSRGDHSEGESVILRTSRRMREREKERERERMIRDI
eukprot:6602197-Pyramimonas_sp.AAC.1